MSRRIFLVIGMLACLLIGITSLLPLQGQKVTTTSIQKKKTICLNMIVKNESEIITDCLSSVKGLIDYWVIVDTGSRDGTQKIIREYMKDIPGVLYERPWIDFSHNRNEAMALAKKTADYTLFIDADEKLVFSSDFSLPTLDQDLYYIPVQQAGSSSYLRWFLIKNTLDWHWEGVLHEQLICSTTPSGSVVKGIVNLSDTTKGARSKDPKKYLHDAQILLQGLSQEPDNSRYQFYLGQCYANAGELCLALPVYQERACMQNGYPEEVFMSLYLTARIQEILNVPSPIVVRSYLTAHAHTPSRLEPLFYLGAHYMRMKKYQDAYQTLTTAANTLPSPTDTLFVESEIFHWRLQTLLAENCWQLQKIPEMVNACHKVANSENAPSSTREEMRKNIEIVKQNGWLSK